MGEAEAQPPRTEGWWWGNWGWPPLQGKGGSKLPPCFMWRTVDSGEVFFCFFLGCTPIGPNWPFFFLGGGWLKSSNIWVNLGSRHVSMCVILVVFAGRKSLPDHVMMFLSFFLLVSRNIQDVLSNFKSRLAYFSRPFFSFPFSCPLFLSLDLHGVWRWYNCNKELPIIQSRERSEIYCRFVCIHIEWPKKDLQSNKSTFWTMISLSYHGNFMFSTVNPILLAFWKNPCV